MIAVVRAALLGALWLVGYALGRAAGAVCRVALWFVGAVVRGFNDAW